MNKQEFLVLLQSLGRIELMIKSIMEEKYGRKETNRVYKEIVKIIDNNIKLSTSLDEPLSGQMSMKNFDEKNGYEAAHQIDKIKAEESDNYGDKQK